MLLGVNALPFGATGSVSSFLRVSMALWYIGVVGLNLAWTVFFDDYTLIAGDKVAENSGKAAEALFDLFGFEYAKDGDKAVPFSEKVRTLGLQLSLGSSEGGFMISHTEERKKELFESLSDIIAAKCVETKRAESLRGRMQWFESYTFGRVAQRSIKVLGDIAFRHCKISRLCESDLEALRNLAERVVKAPPVVVSHVNLKTWLIFTDGAREGSGQKTGTIGGVLVNPRGFVCSHFSEQVPDELMLFLLNESQNPIYELELLPAVVSLWMWGEKLDGAQTVFYLDNEAAKASLVNAKGGTQFGQVLVSSFVSQEAQRQLKVWIARVPSHSNISDGPSRLDDQCVPNLGSRKCDVDWTRFLKDIS